MRTGYVNDPGLKCANQSCPRTSADGRLAKGLCNTHYLAQYHGPRRFGPKPEYLPDANGCWIWQRGMAGGYAKFDSTISGHRWYYQKLRGPIPEGLQLDHLCRVTACVNPWHLEPVTFAENIRRGATTLVCIRGHHWTPENTYRRPDNGKRQCRACIRLRPMLRRYAVRVEGEAA